MTTRTAQAIARTEVTENTVLDVRALKKYFAIRNVWGHRTGWLKALDDVSFTVHKGEILGIVGESGCGKSTLGKTLMGIHQPTEGEIIFEGPKRCGSRSTSSMPERRGPYSRSPRYARSPAPSAWS